MKVIWGKLRFQFHRNKLKTKLKTKTIIKTHQTAQHKITDTEKNVEINVVNACKKHKAI